jgi:hypothetical protein
LAIPRQDAVKVEQKSIGRFEVPRWDMISQKRVREALLALAATLPDMKHAFGTEDSVATMERRPTASPPCPDGITWCVFFGGRRSP